MTIAYSIIFVLSFLVPCVFSLFIHKKEKNFWVFVLNVCVCVVNLGYLLLSLSRTVEFALIANKIAYLGQIFVIMSMYMIISELCEIKHKKWVTYMLIGFAFVMYALVFTTGYLGWYYQSVSLTHVDGAAKLVKEYGPLHPLYLVYVLAYFVAMLVTILRSFKAKKEGSHKLAGLMLSVVFGNIGMWLVEKLFTWNFEFLSVSYLMSEMIFLLIYWVLEDYIHIKDVPTKSEGCQSVIFVGSADRQGRVESIISRLPEGTRLSPRQLDILEGILDGKSRKEIAANLHISENTVKMHTSSLYKVLGVTGRDEIYCMLKSSNIQ